MSSDLIKDKIPFLKPTVHIGGEGFDGLMIHDPEHGEEINFHVLKMEAFTGNDDYQETDQVEISVTRGEQKNSPKLKLMRDVEISPKRSHRRIRSEVGVRIHLHAENSGEVYVMQICHHKGSVYVDLLDE